MEMDREFVPEVDAAVAIRGCAIESAHMLGLLNALQESEVRQLSDLDASDLLFDFLDPESRQFEGFLKRCGRTLRRVGSPFKHSYGGYSLTAHEALASARHHMYAATFCELKEAGVLNCECRIHIVPDCELGLDSERVEITFHIDHSLRDRMISVSMDPDELDFCELVDSACCTEYHEFWDLLPGAFNHLTSTIMPTICAIDIEYLRACMHSERAKAAFELARQPNVDSNDAGSLIPNDLPRRRKRGPVASLEIRKRDQRIRKLYAEKSGQNPGMTKQALYQLLSAECGVSEHVIRDVVREIKKRRRKK